MSPSPTQLLLVPSVLLLGTSTGKQLILNHGKSSASTPPNMSHTSARDASAYIKDEDEDMTDAEDDMLLTIGTG